MAVESGARPRDFAVLARSNGEVEPLARSLRARGVPVRTQLPADFFAQPQVRPLLAYLRVVADPENTLELYALAASQPYLLGGESLTLLLAEARRRHISLWQALAFQSRTSRCPSRIREIGSSAGQRCSSRDLRGPRSCLERSALRARAPEWPTRAAGPGRGCGGGTVSRQVLRNRARPRPPPLARPRRQPRTPPRRVDRGPGRCRGYGAAGPGRGVRADRPQGKGTRVRRRLSHRPGGRPLSSPCAPRALDLPWSEIRGVPGCMPIDSARRDVSATSA